MKVSGLSALLTTLIFITTSGCGEDPKLVAQHEKQKVEVARLKGELALIEEKIKNLPPDVSKELEEAGKTFASQSAELTGLEAEVATLEAKKRLLEKEFKAYQAKYQVQ